MSWSAEADGRFFSADRGATDEQFPHVVVDGAGVEWTVREIPTPQAWARATRCLVLNSRECVRRVWLYPRNWRTMDADALLQLGVVE